MEKELKKKILLFGATGMAGHMAYHYLTNTGKYEIANIVFRNKLTEDSIVLDITNGADVEKAVKDVRPDIIINCIGVLVRGSQTSPDNAILINAYFPHLLKKVSDKVGAKLIHISTDCVFSGNKGDYSESDFRDADDVYGRSKALGEIINNKDLTIRTSIIGPELKKEGEGLFHWFMNQSGKVNGYVNAIWGGVTTLELAKFMDVAIQEELTGLIQLSNGVGINKFDLLSLFNKIWRNDSVEIVPYHGISINKSIKTSERTSYKVPSYENMLIELAEWMNNNAPLYTLYR